LVIDIIKKDARQGVLIIEIDGDPWREVHSSIFGQRPTLPKEISSLAEWTEAFNALEYKQARHYALKRLSERAYYSAELAKTLRNRLVSSSTIERVIQNCQDLGCLNDDEWIDAFIRGHLRRRSSLRSIAWKLQEKGVPSDKAKQAVGERNNPSGEKESIQHLLSTRYRSRDLQDRRERDKVIAALMRKGFHFEAIREAMSRIGEVMSDEWE
jgi:regulatory protein